MTFFSITPPRLLIGGFSRLRNDKDPYLGLVDCAKRIIDEEGWGALYRGWWLTMLFGVFRAFA
jgi:hypothetical protein